MSYILGAGHSEYGARCMGVRTKCLVPSVRIQCLAFVLDFSQNTPNFLLFANHEMPLPLPEGLCVSRHYDFMVLVVMSHPGTGDSSIDEEPTILETVDLRFGTDFQVVAKFRY